RITQIKFFIGRIYVINSTYFLIVQVDLSDQLTKQVVRQLAYLRYLFCICIVKGFRCNIKTTITSLAGVLFVRHASARSKLSNAR
ncbi:MAG: hypothetical protein Q7R49_07175, partial [Candidatus Daviesbacteria bacterium]|nr:hypothetical protein [Candidatus Daviesbacteria bacterium]